MAGAHPPRLGLEKDYPSRKKSDREPQITILKFAEFDHIERLITDLYTECTSKSKIDSSPTFEDIQSLQKKYMIKAELSGFDLSKSTFSTEESTLVSSIKTESAFNKTLNARGKPRRKKNQLSLVEL